VSPFSMSKSRFGIDGKQDTVTYRHS
jgi:hypothetical protein